jgi:hypothetical protein
MKRFACDLLGIKDISPETLNLRKLYTKETIATEPILIIISPGADPSAELRDLAAEITGKDRYSEVNFSEALLVVFEHAHCLTERTKCKAIARVSTFLVSLADCHGPRSNGDHTRSIEDMLHIRCLVMSEESSFSHTLAVDTRKGT